MNDDQTRPGQDLLIESFRDSWSQGIPSLEEFLQRYGQGGNEALIGELVRIDISERRSRGLPVEDAGYRSRFPFLVETPVGLSPATGFSKNEEPSSTSLEQGTCQGDFEIAHLIGKGSYGRVYLARDVTLDRIVALKVTRAAGHASRHSEGRVLARLQHPNIVSVFREQIVEGLSLLAMQFVAGHSLKDWNDSLPDEASQETSANDFYRWAKHDDSDKHASDRNSDTSIAMTMVGLVKKVAVALQHAHGRGVLHHDIKPANILVDTHGVPLLTDFNVSSIRDEANRSEIGGTLAYMAPEHLRALCPDLDGAMDEVDVRSDLYSLGIVLFELLTGQKHWSPTSQDRRASTNETLHELLAERLQSAPRVDFASLGVDSALESILQRALAPRPADRYQTANQFATDLESWLEGRPNVHASKGNLRFQSTQWIARNRRRLVIAGVMCTVLLATIAWTLKSEGQLLSFCSSLAADAHIELRSDNSSGAAERLGRAKERLSQVQLSRFIAPSRFAEVTQRINTVCQQVGNYELQRFESRFGEFSLSHIHRSDHVDATHLIENALRSYGVLQRDDWQQRSPYVELSQYDQRLVSENVTELLVTYVLSQPGDVSSDDRRKVLQRLPADHRSLNLVAQISSQEPDTDLPEPDSVTESFEAYLCGVLASQRGDDEESFDWFGRSLDLRQPGEPSRFWAHYWTGFTCQRLGRHDEAMVQYGVCIGMRPDFAWPVFNLALACLELGNNDLARRSLIKAIDLDPDFTAAYTALGSVEHRSGNETEALAIFQQAMDRGGDSQDLFFNLAVTHLGLGDRTAALKSLQRCLKIGQHDAAAKLMKELEGMPR